MCVYQLFNFVYCVLTLCHHASGYSEYVTYPLNHALYLQT